MPNTTDPTIFTSGRVMVIPFERKFEEAERDTGLKKKLSEPENLSGILNWCIDGLKNIDITGFRAPDVIQQANECYKKQNDRIGRFIEETMEADATAEIKTASAYEAYRSWCHINGFYAENITNFKASLENIGTVKKKRPLEGGNPTPILMGFKLKNQDNLYYKYVM